MLQAKLRIGSAHDFFEREADHVANQVMRMPEPNVQRKCAECEEKDKKTLRRSENRSQVGPETAPPIVYDVLSGSGRPLDASVRLFMEPRFGHDFGNVRVHTGERAAESARSVNALAYTVGRDVVFGAGQYQPESQSGRRLIAHELQHVRQQGGGLYRKCDKVDGGCEDGKWKYEYDGCSIPAKLANRLGIDGDNPAGGKKTSTWSL